jgi:hypothetical protein
MAITRATNLAGLGTVFDALTDGGGLEITSGISTFSRVTVSPRQKTSSGDSLILSTTDSSNKMELLFTQSEANYYRIQSVDQGIAYTPLSLQNDGGNLGIGTTNPGFKADVFVNGDNELGLRVLNSNSGTSATAMYRLGNDLNPNAGFVKINSSTSTGIGGSNAVVLGNGLYWPVCISTGGVERLRVNSVGNIGIGLSPSPWLTPSGGGFAGQLETIAGALWTYSTTQFNVVQNCYFGSGGGIYPRTTGNISLLRQNSGEFSFQSATGTANVSVAPIDRFIINNNGSVVVPSSGKLGIGTTNPDASLTYVETDALFHLKATRGAGNTYRFASSGLNAEAFELFDVSGSQRAFLYTTGTNNSGSGSEGWSFYTNGTKKLGIGTTGTVSIENAYLSFTPGYGIDFSQTANSSGTVLSETLSDYEQGTWAATLSCASSGSVSLLNNGGHYTRIGNICHVGAWIRVNGATTGSASGIINMGGFPFAPAAQDTYRGRIHLTGYALVGVSGGTWGWIVMTDGGSSFQLGYGLTGWNSFTAFTGTNIVASNAEFYVNGFYKVA